MKQSTYSTNAGTRTGNEDGFAQKAGSIEDGHAAVCGVVRY